MSGYNTAAKLAETALIFSALFGTTLVFIASRVGTELKRQERDELAELLRARALRIGHPVRREAALYAISEVTDVEEIFPLEDQIRQILLLEEPAYL